MYNSLEQLKRLPDKTIVYPGHKYKEQTEQTLEEIKQNNRFLSCSDVNYLLNWS